MMLCGGAETSPGEGQGGKGSSDVDLWQTDQNSTGSSAVQLIYKSSQLKLSIFLKRNIVFLLGIHLIYQ